MKYINKFKTTEELTHAIGGGGELSQLEHFVALTEDNKTVHLKPLPNILVITTNNSGTTIYKRTGKQNGKEKITLENGKNTFIDWNYGFYFESGMKQEQITSFDLSKYDTSKVTNMSIMFEDCSGLTSLDLSSFDTSNLIYMTYMFSNCSNLTSLDLSNFDTSKVTNMYGMFEDCSGLTELNISSFDTSNVTNMFSMFENCSGLTSLDLSSFNTSKVTNMYGMLNGCSGLTSLDLSNFDTTNVTNMTSMFAYCNSLTYIKCKQAFKEWCWTNQDEIQLPTAMRDGGGGKWEIVE